MSDRRYTRDVIEKRGRIELVRVSFDFTSRPDWQVRVPDAAGKLYYYVQPDEKTARWFFEKTAGELEKVK